jgi:Icc-related predicted phosphoesterase
MKFLLLSDLHERLPNIDTIPQVNAIIFAGDFALRKRWDWQQEKLVWYHVYSWWLEKIRERGIETIAIAGNHDSIAQAQPGFLRAFFDYYLEEEVIDYHGLKIYGSPWTLPFCDWAFAKEEDEQREALKDLPYVDIFINHGPPFGILDYVDNEYCGSKAVLEYCERMQPKLVVFGHIHEGRGTINRGNTLYVNAAHVDRAFNPSNEYIVWDSDKNDFEVVKAS